MEMLAARYFSTVNLENKVVSGRGRELTTKVDALYCNSEI